MNTLWPHAMLDQTLAEAHASRAELLMFYERDGVGAERFARSNKP